MDRKRAAESAADAACQAEETPKIFRFISPPSVTPEKAKKPRWDEGGESEPEAKEEGIGEEAEADKDNDCVKDEDDSEDEELQRSSNQEFRDGLWKACKIDISRGNDGSLRLCNLGEGACRRCHWQTAEFLGMGGISGG